MSAAQTSWAAARKPCHIDIIYVDANTGGASGGHLALGLGDNVYHFQQHEDGFLRLKRDSRQHFLLIYNHIENRSIFLAQTPVPRSSFQMLEGHFSRLLLSQERNFSNLDALKGNRRFLRSLKSGGAEVKIDALGLFENQTGLVSPDMKRLRSRVIERFGRNFFRSRLTGLDNEIMNLGMTGTPEPVLPGRRTDFVPIARTFYSRLTELVAMKQALRLLNKAAAVRKEVLMDAGPIPECFKTRLKAFGNDIIDSVISLFSSNRPDRAAALLVQMARLQAIEKGLRSGRLLILDPFPSGSTMVGKDVFMKDRDQMERLKRHMRRRLSSRIASLCARESFDEFSYNGLENLAARLVELENGLESGVPVRISDKVEIPCLEGGAAIPKSGIKADPELVKRSERRYRVYSDSLKGLYAYNLVSSNCVTELFRETRTALGGRDLFMVRARPGLEPGAGFIPFRFFDWWVSRAEHCEVIYIPSYRKRRLSGMYKAENDLKAYLRECNTVSSTIYRPSLSDTSFLLFTDDVFLSRPVFGAVNSVWGIASTVLGLVSMPFDQAARLKYGFWGAIYSLPELFFINIRKGSFCWTGREN